MKIKKLSFLEIKLSMILIEKERGSFMRSFVRKLYKKLKKLSWKIMSNGVISIHLKDANTIVKGVCLMGHSVFRKSSDTGGGYAPCI